MSQLDLPAPSKRGDSHPTFITFAASAIPTCDVTAITVRRNDNGESLSFTGRPAWTLAKLASAGSKGITARQFPGVRLAHFVFLLRRAGLDVETIHESHGGPYKGAHGRYRLRTAIHVTEIEESRT